MRKFALLTCLLLAATSLCAQPDIIYYKLDETSGAAAKNHAVPGQGWTSGALSAAPLWNTVSPQVPPAALNNTGQNRRLNTGYSLSERNGQALTIELWFRTTGGGYQDFCNDSVNFGLWLNNGRIQAQVGGTIIQSTNTNNNDGAWRFVALTRNAGNAWALYWGTTAAGLSVATANITHTFSSNAMGVLYWQGGSPATYSGEMDEFRLWGVQRTQAELEASRFTAFATQDIDVFNSSNVFVKHQAVAAFTNVASGTFTDFTFTVRNVRPAGNVNFTPVTLTGITGATVAVISNPSTIAPGATTTFTVRVTPLQSEFNFLVNINNDRSPNPYQFTFNGMMNTGRPEMLYYRFNEGSGLQARNDASPGRGNSPSIFTASSWTSTANARLGASASQNTSNLPTGFSCTDLPRPEFTLEFWLYRSGNGTTTICGDGTSFRVYRVNGTLSIQSGPAGGDQDISTGVALANNAWTHIAIVSNPGVFGLRVYANGAQAFESVNYAFPFADAQLNVMSNAGANNYSGRIDEFRFWAHARSAAQILADRDRELIGRLQVERPSGTIRANGSTDALGSVPTGTAQSLTYTLRNIGSTGLLLGNPAVSVSGATNCTANVVTNPSGLLVAASGTTSGQVDVTPTAAGAFSCQLLFASNDPDVPSYVINVSGTGVPGEIQIERPLSTIIADNGPDAIGSSVAGFPVVLTYTVRNVAGTGNINLGALTANLFANCGVVLTPPGVTVLAPGTSTTLQATVTPTAAGAFSFSLHLVSDDLNENPYDINVSGTATAPQEINVQRPVATNIADGGNDVVTGTVAGVATVLTYTIQNIGGSPLSLTGRSVANLVNCGVVLGSFSANPVAASSSATLTVTLTPIAAGGWSFDLDIDNNDANENPYDIAVSGTALVGGEINVQRAGPVSIADGGSHAVTGTVAGAPAVVTYTIQNLGTATLTLTGRSVSALVNCGVSLGAFSAGTVAPAGSATLAVTITPTSAGAWSFDLDINSDDLNENPYDIAVSGTAVVGGEINVQRAGPVSIADGGSHAVTGTVAGAPTVVTYTIQNLGTATLTLTARSTAALINCGVSLGAFSSGTVAPAGSATLAVTITPTAAGAWSFDLDINSDDLDENPYDIAISGSAIPGGEINVQRAGPVSIADGGSHAVTGTAAGAPTVVTYTIQNLGTATLTLTARSTAALVNCGVSLGAFSAGTVAPAGSATLAVTITPTAAGAWSFDLDINSDDLDENPYDIAISGTATVGGEINVQRAGPVSIADGGSHVVTGTVAGAPTVVTYTIQNLGTATLTLTGRSVSALVNCNIGLGSFSTGTVAPAASATLDLTITPTAGGVWSFDLDIASDDVDENPYDIAVSGTAVSPEINVQRAGPVNIVDGGSHLVTGTVAGAPTVVTYTIQNLGTATLTLTARSTAALINCGVSLGSFSAGTVAPAGTATLAVTITPIAAGAWSFDLDINSDDLDENPYDIAISGTAITGGEINVQRAGPVNIADGGSHVVTGTVAGAPTVVTYTIQNLGTATLTLTGRSTAALVNCGVSLGAFSAGTVAPAGSATLAVTITPGAAGAWSFDLDIASDDLDENPYDIAISGTAAVGGEINVQRAGPVNVPDNGSHVVTGTVAGAPTVVTYTIQNLGTATLTLTGRSTAALVNCGVSLGTFSAGTVAPAGSATLAVTITPTAAGNWSFDLDINSDDLDENPYDIAVSGTAAVGGEINVQRAGPVSIADGGSHVVAGTVAGAPTVVTYTIQNLGTATLTLTARSTAALINCGVSLGAFSAGTVAPAGSATLAVTITPTAAGIWSFDLDINSDDLDENPYDIAVSGTAAVGGEINVQRDGPVNIADGGNHVVTGTVAGAPTVVTYTIQNLGTATLTLTARSTTALINCGVSLGAFSSGTVAPAGTATLAVTITPTAAGAWGFDLDISSDDLDENPYDIAVSGTALVGGEINVQRAGPINIADGGSHVVTGTVAGAPTVVTYTIQNLGTATLTLTGRSAAAQSNCGVGLGTFSATVLAPATSATLDVTITPTAAGNWSFDLDITSDDLDENPYDIAVSGSAIVGGEIDVQRPALTSIADGGTDSQGGTVAGVPTVITYTIRNFGTATLLLTGQGALNESNCTVGVGAPSSASLGVGGTATLAVTITPTTSASWSFDLEIFSDDVDENPYSIAVSGSAAPGGEIDMQRPAATSIADGGNDTEGGTVAGVPALLTYTIRNFGSSALTISGQGFVGNTNCNVSVGAPSLSVLGVNGTATLDVTVTPIAAGNWSFTLQVMSNDLDEATYDIFVSGTAAPGGEIDMQRPAPTSIADGGSDVVGGTVAGAGTVLTYTIRNFGTADLTLSGQGFISSSNCAVSVGTPTLATIGVGGTATLGVTVTPTVAGAWSFTLQVMSNDVDEGTYDILVSGAAAPGGEIDIQRPAPTSIASGGNDTQGGTVAGVPALLAYTIRNFGTAVLNITGQGFSGNSNCGVSVAAPSLSMLGVGGTATLDVTVTPTATGNWNFVLQVSSDDVDEGFYTINVSGTAVAGGEIDVQRPAPTSIADGGNDPVSGTVNGAPTLLTYTIRNFGTADLNISGQGFISNSNCNVSVGTPSLSILGVSGTATLDVTVTPIAPGAWSFTLQVSSDDIDEATYDISVSGTASPNSSVTGVTVGPDDGGPLTVQATINGPVLGTVDVVVTYTGGLNAGPPVLISTSAGVISGNTITGIAANSVITFRWDAYATERHTTDTNYVLTLQPSIGAQPGTPGSSPAFTLTRDGGWAKHVTPTEQGVSVFGHVAIYDDANDRMILFGGKRNGVRSNQVWAYERGSTYGPGWRKLSPAGTQPPELQYASAIYDSANDRMIVFGGQSNSGNRNQTWALDLTRGAETWTEIATVSPPAARYGAALVYDNTGANPRAILHGGVGTGYLGDAWELDLTSGLEAWGGAAMATLGTPPSARMGHAAAFDPIGNRMVIYGGSGATGTIGDVHELAFGGTPMWSLITGAAASGSRYFSTWTHDSVNNALVVQSGFNGGSYLGNSWIMPLQGPSQHVWSPLPNDPLAGNGRVVGSAAFDASRVQALFYGGIANTGAVLTAFSALDLGGTPAWQTTPVSASPELSPAARWGASLVFDSTINRVVLFGGKDNSGMFNDVWVLSRATATAAWAKFSTTGASPAPRVYHSAIYDSAAQRLVVFGGHDSQGVKLQDLWALDLSGPTTGAWTQLSAGGGPSARLLPAMAYDSLQQRVVLFGGLGGTYFNDTWVWDLTGGGWLQLAPTGTLPATTYSSRAMFDASLNRMVVVGGLGSLGFHSRVYALDLTPGLEAWTDISAVAGPVMPGRSDFAMGFDSAGRKAWIFGGYNGGQFADLWELDVNGPTAVWAPLSPPVPAPAARHALAGCLDGSGRLVAGFGYVGGPVADLWSIDPANVAGGWSNPVIKAVPARLVTGVVALDSTRRHMIAFGGLADGQPVDGLFWLNLNAPISAWQPLAASGTGPSARRTASMVYDAANDRMILFGGRTGVANSTIVAEVWALSLSGTPTWSLLTTSGASPGPRAQHVAVVDGNGNMVIWGGRNSGGTILNTAFELNLSTLAWTDLAPSGPAPLGRTAAAAIYDITGNRMIIYGGENNGAVPYCDVLSLAGSPGWSTLGTSGAQPGALQYQSMIYDHATRRILLFGGFNLSAQGSLYQLNLNTGVWSLLTPPVASPQARWAHGAIWDAVGNRMVVVGGYLDGELPALDPAGAADLWFWGD